MIRVCTNIFYIYIKSVFPMWGGGGWTTCTATHVWEWLYVFSSEILSSFNLLFHWGRGGGWTTCTAAHVWEWLCVFLSEILSSLLWRRSKIKPHKLLLFIICVIMPHFFCLDFLSYCFFFSLWDPFTIPYSYLQSIFWKYYPHNSI